MISTAKTANMYVYGHSILNLSYLYAVRSVALYLLETLN